ncbi:ATP-binding protein [Desulfococcus multivorans]|uniref:ATP-binding protein n=1 Tax=Desulfococcus multivorans TaxID=897 RepID=UPI0012948510|nr:transporter substrate-binding domain-containing protein [Desulfococcus multivorans]
MKTRSVLNSAHQNGKCAEFSTLFSFFNLTRVDGIDGVPTNRNSYNSNRFILIRVMRRALYRLGIMTGILLVLICPAHSALRVGMPIAFPPFSYQGEGDDRVRGYSVDVMETLGGIMDEETRFLVGEPEDLLTALAEDRIDMVCGVVLTESIRQAYDYLEISVFVKRFFYANQAGVDPDRRHHLAGKTVVVVRGQPFMDLGLQREGVNIVQARDILEALRMLDGNQAQLFVGLSEQVVKTLTDEFDLKRVRQAGVTIGQFPLAVIVPKGNTALLKRLSMGLGMAVSDGSLGRVQEKWLGGWSWAFFWIRYRLYVSIFIGIFAAGIGGIILWNQTLKRQVVRITRDLGVSEQRYRDVIESSPDMVFVINGSGEIRLANTSARRKLSWDEATLHCTALPSLAASADRTSVDRFLHQLFADGYAGTEIRLIASTGVNINVEMVAAGIQQGSADEPLACCFARDITRRKRMAVELIQAERLATIGKMAASVAHEINNPVGIVLAHTEELMSGGLSPEEIRNSLDVIRRNAVRAGRITETLLAQASQSPEGTGFAGRMVVDLAGLIEECIHFVRPRLRRIRLQKGLPTGLFPVQGDAGSLQQVFINLLLNAAESIDGEGVIRVWLVNERTGLVPMVSAVVEDSGIGVPEADRERIFEPFFTRGKQRGFGLGLFVARNIVARHGGDIRCEPGTSGGTRMIVRIPQRELEADGAKACDNG